MKKSDLKTGMQVEQRCGDRKFVLLGTKEGDKLVEVNDTGHGRLANYLDDLTCGFSSDFDIVKIYQGNIHTCHLGKASECRLIWERKPEIEITVKVNGKETSLKNISEETLLNIRNNS